MALWMAMMVSQGGCGSVAPPAGRNFDLFSEICQLLNGVQTLSPIDFFAVLECHEVW